PATAEAQQTILAWRPVRDMLAAMDPVNFWGRAQWPMYGGPLSTYATLCLLAELGVPLTPQIRLACENLLDHGQLPNGGFSRDHTEAGESLCLTGNAVRALLHFGYADDPRVDHAFQRLLQRSIAPGGLGCACEDAAVCEWGVVKALTAFATLPASHRSPTRTETAHTLADVLFEHRWDFDARDEHWLSFGFPRDYQSDLVELCDVLVRLELGADRRIDELLHRLSTSATPEGRWIKHSGTRALYIEHRGEPSKWITIQALRALQYAGRAGTQHIHRTMQWERDMGLHETR
ncbi:MAG: hypothetical protein GX601_15120, partial [Anaerolineales bacterium]|nr:hypothetical protein [Anaerolineales bacterium]